MYLFSSFMVSFHSFCGSGSSHKSALRRFTHRERHFTFVIDRSHFKNHTTCHSGYNIEKRKSWFHFNDLCRKMKAGWGGWVGLVLRCYIITCQRRCCAQNQHSVQTTQNVDSEEMPFVAVYVILINEMGFRDRLLFLKTQNVDSEAMPFLHVYVMLNNKMGCWYRLLFLRTSPNQQKGSLRRTETTNLTVTEHHPHQQICWSTKWVDHQDCCFWPPFTFLVSPTGTKWGSVPICIVMKVTQPRG